jgi:hypothetical protein
MDWHMVKRDCVCKYADFQLLEYEFSQGTMQPRSAEWSPDESNFFR